MAVTAADSRGAAVISVANFSGNAVLTYLIGPIDAWGDQLFGGLGSDGNAEFEFTGRLTYSGKPFVVDGAEVP